jgi:hypothetical protein
MTRPDETGPNVPRRRRGAPGYQRPLVVAGAVILGIAAIIFAVSWTHAPWRDYVHRKPASYVELTFVQAQELPAAFVAGQPVRFTFSIHNVDAAGTHRTIDWTTSVRDTVTGTVTSAARAEAVIGAGATKTISGQVTINGANRNEVIVKLGSGQQIDFYVAPRETTGSK